MSQRLLQDVSFEVTAEWRWRALRCQKRCGPGSRIFSSQWWFPPLAVVQETTLSAECGDRLALATFGALLGIIRWVISSVLMWMITSFLGHESAVSKLSIYI
jgi:hypothetical protein